jgi:outer membrane protein
MKLRVLMAVIAAGAACAQSLAPEPLPDYSIPARVFPRIWEPYKQRAVPEPPASNPAPLEVKDGKLQLSMRQVISAVIANNLAVASARLFPSIAQTDLMRARSGQSARGVDATVIPSVVFAGAEGGSILGTAGGGGGGASNAGGITGAATSVNIRPAGVFDPTLSLTTSYDRTASPLNTLVVSGIPDVTNGTFAINGGYTQAFSQGGSFSVSYGLQRQASTQLHLLFNPYFSPGFTAAFNQQLLNGFGFKVNRALIEVAQNEQKIERESFRLQTTTALVTAQNAYWDLMSAQESLRAAKLELEAAQQLAQNNRKELEAGAMSQIDVVTADSQVASSKRDLIVAQTNEQTAEITLKSLISKTLDEPLASAEIETTDAFPEPDMRKLGTLDQLQTIAKENRPDIAIAEGNLKSEKDVIPFIKNSLLPNLNVFALVNSVSLFNAFGPAFNAAFEWKYPQVAFGMSLTFPLRNRQAQADDMRSRLELLQSQDTLVRTKSQVDVDVQNGFIASTQGAQQVLAAREALRLSEAQLDAEQKKLDVGLSTPYNVILQQRDVFTARLAYAQAEDTYAKARVTLDQAMGTTLDSSHITIEEALAGAVK